MALDIRSGIAYASLKSTGGEFGGEVGLIMDKSSPDKLGRISYRTGSFGTWDHGTLGDNNFTLYNTNIDASALTVNNNNNYIGIGTSTPFNKLVISDNTINNPTCVIENLFQSLSYNDGLWIKAGRSDGTGGSFFVGFAIPANLFIGSISQVDENSVAYSTTSDKRLKKNIHQTKFGLDDVKKIEVRDYNFFNSKNEQTGFIAQQLYQVFPGAVTVGGDDPKKRPWMIDYGRITPLLVKAIQDLSGENDEKETIITAMQQQIDDLATELKNLKSLIVHGTIGTPGNPLSGYLRQNNPNPANNSTVISYYLPENTRRGEIRITDTKGSSIKTYNASKGTGQLNIKRGDLPAGAYNYTLYANNKLVDTKQMVIDR